MKNIIYTLIFLAFASMANAQWVRMSNGMGTGPIHCLAAIGNNIFAGPQIGIYLSTNNGTSWTQTSLNNQTVNSLLTRGNTIFAGGSGDGVFISTNNGITWIQTGLSGKMVISLATLGNNIFAGTQGYGVYLSTNNGTSWTQTSLNNQWVFSLATLGNNIFAAGFYYGIYLSTNNGSSWTQIQSPLNDFVLSFATHGNNIFAGTAESGVYLSTNNGSNWIEKNQGFDTIPHNVTAFLITNNYIFAGTNNRSVWRRDLSELFGIKKISEIFPASYSLSQNYPNPFNPTTKIRFDVPKQDFITINIFDVLGRAVATLVNEQLKPGTYEVDFDGSNYTSGVYFYKLTTDNFIETKRMILVK